MSASIPSSSLRRSEDMLARADTPAWDATMKRLIAHSATERADATAAPLLPAPSSPAAPHPSDDDDRAAGGDDGGDESEEARGRNYYYFRLIANLREVRDGSPTAEFLYDELPFLDPRRDESEFYIVDREQQRGINCRFGMRGVTAANHFDMSRNTISVLGGERRYVLAHPGQCGRMSLHPRGHPSVRHSSFDWGDPAERKRRPEFEDALLQEVVLHEGDVLYLPTNWFHFIVNLSLNYQCNARSGTTFETADIVGACGFKMEPGDFRVQ